MKVINKILCFLSVLLLCVPLLCFNVSADTSVGNPVREWQSTFDVSQYEVFSSSSSTCKDSSMIRYRYWENYPTTTNREDYFIPFDLLQNSFLPFIYQRYYYLDSENLYYIMFTFGSTVSDFRWLVFSSNSPITLTLKSDGYVYFNCTTDIVSSEFHIDFSSGYSYFDYVNYGSSSCGTSSYLKYPNIKFSSNCTSLKDTYYSSCPKSGTSFESRSWDNIYSNCDLIDKSILPNLTENKILEIGETFTLIDYIDVKLTPEFGLDMDRIDPLTNQSDYFKFEITNNSDSAIQWCAGIYDPELVTADTMDILNLSSWAYVSRTTYYDFSVKEDKGIFRTTYTYSGALKTGSFDYHYLEPGETFSDLIFWENIKINPNVIYHFFVNAVKSDLNYASLNIDPPVTEESSDMHSVTVIEDTYYNTILEGASSFRKLDCNIYNIEFSCLSMPAFTTTVRGGNSVLNTSGNDRYLLKNNYESVSDINGLDTKINKNYTDPSILANTFNRSDVSVDIDSFSVDDVKSYITSCQSFFILIKEALLSFPAFIWALICFGLTGLIVIAVVKALL